MDSFSQWLMFSGEQLRAARALLNWSRDQLSDASGVSAIAIKEFEVGSSDPRRSTLLALRTSLSKEGVIFLDGSTIHGLGVAFRSEAEARKRASAKEKK